MYSNDDNAWFKNVAYMSLATFTTTESSSSYLFTHGSHTDTMQCQSCTTINRVVCGV